MEQQDVADPLETIYSAIDWNVCVIGGSGALRRYTNAAWKENDTDVFCSANSASEFIAIVDTFIQQLDQRLTVNAPVVVEKFEVITDEKRREASVTNGRDERFHDSILATTTLRVPGVSTPVQLVGINTVTNMYGRQSLGEHLNVITDLPAAVQYTARHGEKIFHVPYRALAAIATKRVPVVNICATRKAKYEARGYEFY